MHIELVNICMLAYNQINFISKAIESVLKQKTNFKLKLIIGDDCSTDGTRNIIKDYYERYPDQIELILHSQNQGPQLNVLSILKRCAGKYVAFLEGDDYWTDPYKLQKQVDLLEANPQYSMCFTNSVIIDAEGKVIKTDRVPEDKRHDLCQRETLGYCPPTNTAVVKNELIKRYLPHFNPGIINGDYFLFSLVTQYGNAAYLDINSAAYRMHSNGIWANKSTDYTKINYIKVCRALYQLIDNENKQIIGNNLLGTYEELNNLNRNELFLDNGLWTPQTAMLRSIRDLVMQVEGYPVTALSIDKNPTLEQIIKRKWPEIEITTAEYPEYDVQNLHQLPDENFDVVFSHQVMEHVPKPWIAAKEIVRVLKSGGIGIHTSCAYNPKHGDGYGDYYRFLPDGLAELFEGVEILVKEGWGNRQALLYNLAIDDGYGALGGRRFTEAVANKNEINYPWHTWVVFQKL